MKHVSGRWWLVCLCVGLLAMSGVAAAQEVSLKAVAKNGVPITPTNSVTAVAGDTIKCEFYGSGWSAGAMLNKKLRAWQVHLNATNFGTAAMPVGLMYWDRPSGTSCVTNANCPAGDICYYPPGAQSGICAGPNHHPETASFIDSTRTNYVFAPNPQEMTAVDYSEPSLRFGSLLLQPGSSPSYTPPPKYLATSTVKLIADACGTFTVGPYSDMAETYFIDSLGVIYGVTVVGLQIDAGACVCKEIGSVDPIDCAIDARQPSKPDGTAVDGWKSMTFTFLDAPALCNPCNITPDNFSVRVVPAAGVAPFVSSVTCTANTATAVLNKVIPLSRWTCITYLPGNLPNEFCMGHQPADVNGDRTSAPADILRVIDCLNHVATCTIYQCDVDRSAVCGPPDILRVIDLLNGAGAYDPWLNDRIDPCP